MTLRGQRGSQIRGIPEASTRWIAEARTHRNTDARTHTRQRGQGQVHGLSYTVSELERQPRTRRRDNVELDIATRGKKMGKSKCGVRARFQYVVMRFRPPGFRARLWVPGFRGSSLPFGWTGSLGNSSGRFAGFDISLPPLASRLPAQYGRRVMVKKNGKAREGGRKTLQENCNEVSTAEKTEWTKFKRGRTLAGGRQGNRKKRKIGKKRRRWKRAIGG